MLSLLFSSFNSLLLELKTAIAIRATMADNMLTQYFLKTVRMCMIILI